LNKNRIFGQKNEKLKQIEKFWKYKKKYLKHIVTFLKTTEHFWKKNENLKKIENYSKFRFSTKLKFMTKNNDVFQNFQLFPKISRFWLVSQLKHSLFDKQKKYEFSWIDKTGAAVTSIFFLRFLSEKFFSNIFLQNEVSDFANFSSSKLIFFS